MHAQSVELLPTAVKGNLLAYLPSAALIQACWTIARSARGGTCRARAPANFDRSSSPSLADASQRWPNPSPNLTELADAGRSRTTISRILPRTRSWHHLPQHASNRPSGGEYFGDADRSVASTVRACCGPSCALPGRVLHNSGCAGSSTARRGTRGAATSHGPSLCAGSPATARPPRPGASGRRTGQHGGQSRGGGAPPGPPRWQAVDPARNRCRPRFWPKWSGPRLWLIARAVYHLRPPAPAAGGVSPPPAFAA